MGESSEQAHPMGELSEAVDRAVERLRRSAMLATDGGRVHVGWSQQAAVTPLGHFPLFIEFLTTAGRFDHWVDSCPLEFQSNNASAVRDVLGTWLLSILSGHPRDAHVTRLRGDTVGSGLLGMNQVMSEDSLRRALKKNR